MFVKLQTPATVPVHVTPCLGSFENRGSYIKFLGQELLSGPAVKQTHVNILALLEIDIVKLHSLAKIRDVMGDKQKRI